MKKYLCLLLLVIFAQSCQWYFDLFREIELSSMNNTDFDIWYSFGDNRYRTSNKTFSDGGITVENYQEYFNFEEPDTIEVCIFVEQGCDWEDLFPEGLYMRIWKDAVIEEIGWERFLRENGHQSNLFEVEYVLSLADLDRLDYYMPFPPDERMRDIEMYPSYEEVVERYPAMVGRSFKDWEEHE